ncbi:MAG: ABC transporter substrate-binding protein [Labilithrix sp.]|nr:ABC transporter substrate-binding protein [Labilithrix sp.]
MSSRLAAGAAALALFFFHAVALAGDKLKVIVPDHENLQYTSFWVAKAGGFFEREGLEVELVVAPKPANAETMFAQGAAEAAVLPPTMYLRLIAEKKPIVLVANLLRNDPNALVVRREILAERRLTSEMPLRDRVSGLKGLRIGVPPQLPARLGALVATQGLDREKDIETEVLLAKLLNGSFHDKKVDALYVPSPFLEKAIVDDDAVVIVDQPRGEVKALSNRVIHTLAFSPAASTARRPVVLAAVRAIAEAQKSIRASGAGAVEALAKEMPSRSRKELEAVVRVYAPAIPETPEVRAEDLAPALELFPEGVPRPDLTGIDLAAHVATDVAPKPSEAANDDGRQTRWIIGVVSLVALLGAALFFRKKRSQA